MVRSYRIRFSYFDFYYIQMIVYLFVSFYVGFFSLVLTRLLFGNQHTPFSIKHNTVIRIHTMESRFPVHQQHHQIVTRRFSRVRIECDRPW